MFSFHIYALRRERWKESQATISTIPPTPGFREKAYVKPMSTKTDFFPP